jgi:anti-sigma factor RsiW
MNCSRAAIEGYLDRELDSSRIAEVEEHLAACAECAAEYEQLRAQQADIRSQGLYYAAPPALRQSVRNALRESAEGGGNRATPWRWLAIAASVLLVVSVTFNVLRLPRRMAENEVVAQALIDGHVRSLMGTHLLDVESTDQHTVKPWFNGKLDFSPNVQDCAGEGFPLIGGRIEYVSNRAVAALVYRRRQHVINVFTWPSAPSDAKESRAARNGYNVVQWSDGGMTYWAVSDLNAAEIQQLKDLCIK